MPSSILSTIFRPLFQGGDLTLLRSPASMAGPARSSAGLFGDDLVRGLSNVSSHGVDERDKEQVSSVHLLARLAIALPNWPDNVRIELLDGRTTRIVGASNARKTITIHAHGDRCFSKKPELTRNDETGGKAFTDSLVGLLTDDEKRQLLDLPESVPLPDNKVLDARLRFLLGEQLHRLLLADADLSQWARSDGAPPLATQAVIDLGLILSSLAAITGVSWAGSPTIAGVQVPGLPMVGSVQSGPLAAMFLAGSVTLGMLAKLYQAQHRQPVDGHAALIELLFGDRLTKPQRAVLLEKVRPYATSLTPALVVAHVHKLLDSLDPSETVETALQRLPVSDWSRAAAHQRDAFDPLRVGKPSDLAAAFENFVNVFWGSQVDSGKPVAERLLNAFGLSTPARASYAEKSLQRQLNSLENQREVVKRASGNHADRLELERTYWDLKHDVAMKDGASNEELRKFQQRFERTDLKQDLHARGRAAYIEEHDLHSTKSSARGYGDAARADDTRRYSVYQWLPVHQESRAGALTELGEEISSHRTTSFIFPGTSASALRAQPVGPSATTSKIGNVALLSGRAYQLRLNQRLLEETIPGWMLAEPAEQNKVRRSLADYARVLPVLVQWEKDVAALPEGVADHLQSRIKAHFGLDIDPRNVTLHSQTWATQTKWEMANAQPVQIYHAGPPKKTDINRSLWEAAQENFQGDEGSPEFMRGPWSAQHVSISQGATDGEVIGTSIREWVKFIRNEDLGNLAQQRLDDILDSAKPTLLGSYPVALKTSLDVALLGDFHADSAELLREVLEHPDDRPTTWSGRRWQVSPLRLLDSELEVFVFHTGELRGTGLADTHRDGGVLYIPNQCLRAFSSATELGDLIVEITDTPSGLALLAERVPLDLRESFIRRAKVAVESGHMRNFQIGLGKELQGKLWDAMYQREQTFRKRNLRAQIKPTADVDLQTTIMRRMEVYQAVTGMIGALSGLPLIGPAFIGANLAAFATTAMEYTQLRRQEGSEHANELLPDLLNSLLSVFDFEPGDVPSAMGRGLGGGRAGALPRYFKVADPSAMILPPADSSGLMHVNRRTYARMDNGDLVEVDASEPTHPRLMGRWHDVVVHGPELLHQADNRWSLKSGDIDSLTPAQLFKRMLPEDPAAWSTEQMQHLIDDLGLDHASMRDLWDGGSPSSLLTEHMRRYQHLIDLDALPDVLNSDFSSVPQNMQPVIAQALADRTGRPLEVYVEGVSGVPSLKARYEPSDRTVRIDESLVQVLEREGVEYTPLSATLTNQNVPNRLSLIDSVIDSVPGFGVNSSRLGAKTKAVRREQVVAEVISRIRKERAAFQEMGLGEVSTPAAPFDVPTGTPSQVLHSFPLIPMDLLHRVSAELDRDGGATVPFDSGKAGGIVDDHYTKVRRNDALFRLQNGPHTEHSEAVYFNVLVTDPAWPKDLAVEVIPATMGRDGLYPSSNKASRVYGKASPERRLLQLYRREDGTYAAIASDGRERGGVPMSAGHAPDDLGGAVLQAMTSGDRGAWTSDPARSDVNGWIASRARRLDSVTFDARMKQESTALNAFMLSDITPDPTSLHGRQMRDDGTYKVDGKIYLHAFGHTYRLKQDGKARYRVISAVSSEDQSASSSYAGLDFAPLIRRNRHGVWGLDTKDRLWTFHKLGSITEGVDVAQARVVLDITGVSLRQLKNIQLGKKDPSPELGDAITRARMRSVIGRLSRDADHFNDLQDPTPVLALLTRLEGWPSDTAIEVSDQDGYISPYSPPGATQTVRVALDDLQSPILQSFIDLFGTVFLSSIISESPSSSLPLRERLGNALSHVAGSYPNSVFDVWYVKSEEPETMLSEQLMQQVPGLTKRAAEHILFNEKITRRAHLMPNGQLADNVKSRAQEASQTTRAQRLAEAVRTGRVIATNEKSIVKDLLSQLPGWDVDLVIDTDGDMVLYQGGELRRIRGDGDGGSYQVLDSDARVLSKHQDIYTGIWLALNPTDREKLGLNPVGVDALRGAVWKQADQDKDIFRRHGEAMDETSGSRSSLCRVRRAGDTPGGCAGVAIPKEAEDARKAVVASQASMEVLAANKRSSSASSSKSAGSVRSQIFGTSNFASVVVARPIKLSSRRDVVKFPKIDETYFAIKTPALVSQSSASQVRSNYLIFASTYDNVEMPEIKPEVDLLKQIDDHNTNGGVSVPGRRFKYQVQLEKGGQLALNRPSDTEAALLEYVDEQIRKYVGSSPVLPNPNLLGKLVVYTELTPCESCQNIIRQFIRDYPGIELEVYYSFKGNRERSATPLADADIHLWR